MMNKCCYVCVLSTDDYLKGILVLNENLKHLNTKYDLLCLINNNILLETRRVLEFFGIKYKVIDEISYDSINIENPYWIYTFDKINIFSLVEYEKIVYLDSDLLILNNIDELFDYNSLSMCKDAPFSELFNTGVIVLNPNLDDYNKMKDLVRIQDTKNQKISDQNIINEYFNGKINQLDQIYNEMRIIWDYDFKTNFIECYDNYIDAKIYKKNVELRLKTENPKILHYIGQSKPFNINGMADEKYSYLYIYYLSIVDDKLKEFDINGE